MIREEPVVEATSQCLLEGMRNKLTVKNKERIILIVQKREKETCNCRNQSRRG